MSRYRSTRPPGSALLVVMIGLVALSVLVVLALRFTGANQEAAARQQRVDAVSACALVARQHLLSRLNLFGVAATGLQVISPTEIVLDETLPTAGSAAERLQIKTGHYDQVDAGMTVTAVAAVSVGNAKDDVRGLANIAPAGRSMAQTYQVVVKCRQPPPAGAPASYVPVEQEVEFLFRFGL